MQRYLAFGWPPASEGGTACAASWSAQLAARPAWRPALRREGLEVWTIEGRGPALHHLGDSAVVLGHVLESRGGGRACPPALPGDPTLAARRLRDDAWGAYVALFTDPNDGLVAAFREPSGGLDAITWRRGDLVAVADDTTHLPPGFAPAEAGLDWDAITAVVADAYATGHLSPLAGYAALAPGVLREFAGPADRDVAIWRPSDVARRGTALSAEALRDVVVRAVEGLARPHARILVDASGGLDSSIVCAGLALCGAGDRVAAAVNYHVADAAGDERQWAGAVCTQLGLPLVTVDREAPPLVEADFAELARHVGPALSGLDTPRDRDAAARAQALGATAIFGGQGGDAVFFQLPTAQVIADLFRSQGARAWRHPLITAWPRWLRRSVWSVLWEASHGTPPGPDGGWSTLLGPRVRAGPAVARHPWLRDLDDLPPAKQLQIRAAVGTGHHHWGRSRRSRAADIVQPLLSQPVLEACLATPTWTHVEGGRDRALARAAFAKTLPASVLDRRSKGALGSHYARRAAASLDFLRPHLLDGALCDAGVLDRAAVEAALRPEALIWTAAGARLTRAALIESWVRYWQTQVPDAPRGARR
ncbi:MAG: asparagine synthase [Phenylobacterium sp.]|uniref:asparagine synthase-related protein n=1 Tax=Phenylobacterium sp. TaxID=1871053 RepID=UPI00121DDCB9|nr:asparagine synthase C-terminal domain-containing protein [Phenylobacterium sp.]TAJ71801.1 MAG: asparagine synthase [Phenylobacterium sp.]